MDIELKKEALLNEYKGSLFEFLVARELAKKFQLEISFIGSLSDKQLAMYEQQESYLRNYFSSLLISLPNLARLSAQKIIEKKKLKKIDNLRLVGMNAGRTTEADILIQTGRHSFPVSLKISKSGSFTNTKSAGVKTFFSKYFGVLDQSEFNFFYEQKFEEFTFALLDDAGLAVSSNFKEWEAQGLATLPGELTGKAKERLFDFYKIINLAIYEKLYRLQLDSAESFQKAIVNLLGFSDPDLLQLTCFYHKEEDSYQLDSLSLKTLTGIYEQKEKAEIKQLEKSIEIIFSKFKLQVRLKPMNKFTATSYKVNCAVKFN